MLAPDYYDDFDATKNDATKAQQAKELARKGCNLFFLAIPTFLVESWFVMLMWNFVLPALLTLTFWQAAVLLLLVGSLGRTLRGGFNVNPISWIAENYADEIQADVAKMQRDIEQKSNFKKK